VSGRRLLAIIGAVIACLGLPGVARTEDQGVIYQRYADIREKLYSCEIGAAWDVLGADEQRACRKLQGWYVLYTWPGENWYYHVHCRSPQHCLATPYGEPPADKPIPDGSRTFN
jgi:hypothetical protein